MYVYIDMYKPLYGYVRANGAPSPAAIYLAACGCKWFLVPPNRLDSGNRGGRCGHYNMAI